MKRWIHVAAVAMALMSPTLHALYDPAPDKGIAAVEGAWSGTLTYKDYQKPDRRVTLPTQLYTALTAPDELALHYVFDDGPGKTVQSYERIRFDFESHRLLWTSGTTADDVAAYDIVDLARQGDGLRIVAQRYRPASAKDSAEWIRSTFQLAPARLQIESEDGTELATLGLRNRYVFERRH